MLFPGSKSLFLIADRYDILAFIHLNAHVETETQSSKGIFSEISISVGEQNAKGYVLENQQYSAFKH